MSGETIEEIVDRAKEGDEAASEELYHMHSHRIYSLCLRMVRNQADAEDRIILAVLHDVAQAAAVADQLVLLYGDGRSEAGPAAAMLVPARLAGLYGMPMRAVDGGVLPDFGGMA